MIKTEKLEGFDIPSDAPVKVTKCGNIISIQFLSKRNNRPTIKMLEGGLQYVELSTGEIKDCIKHNSRADQKQSLFRTFSYMRDMINCNTDNPNQCRWVTLTYQENMRDTKRLYKDFDLFYKNFKYFCSVKHHFGNVEYISVAEPQGRGAWHMHIIFVFTDRKYAPFIHYSKLSKIWKHGTVDIRSLKNIDNVGAYLTAYLGDMEVDDVKKAYDFVDLHREIKEVEIIDDKTGKPIKKKFVKGARLPLYPANFNIFRCSRGLKKPETFQANYNKNLIKKLGLAEPNFSKCVQLSDDTSGFNSIVCTKYYNILNKNSQEN